MKKYGFIIFIAIIAIFFGKEFLVSQNNSLQIVAEKDYLLIKSSTGNIWGYGNTPSPDAVNLAQSLSSFFRKPQIIDIFSLDKDKHHQDSQITLTKISQNVAHIAINDTTLLAIHKDFSDDEREKLINSPVSLKADFHILNKNSVLSFLPQPRQGVLYISNNNPSKKTNEIFREKNIPLISTRETGGFMLEITKYNVDFFTR